MKNESEPTTTAQCDSYKEEIKGTALGARKRRQLSARGLGDANTEDFHSKTSRPLFTLSRISRPGDTLSNSDNSKDKEYFLATYKRKIF